MNKKRSEQKRKEKFENKIGRLTDSEFKNFKKKFLKTERGERVSLALNKIKSPKFSEGRFKWLEDQVCWIIYQLEDYEISKDPIAARRLQWKEGEKLLPTCIKAAGKLEHLYKKYPDNTGMLDFEIWKAVSKRFKPKSRIDPHDFALEVIQAIKKGLEIEKETRSNPQEGLKFSWWIAGLQFPEILRDGNPFKKPKDLKKVSLFFHLVLTFRLSTSKEPHMHWFGDPIPKIGRPCHAAVAEIATAVFGDDISTTDVSNIVGRWTDLGVTPRSDFKKWVKPTPPS